MTRIPACLIPGRRIRIAALTLGGIAAVAVAAATAGPAAARTQHSPAAAAAAAGASVPVVISCTGQAQTKPGSYVLACGDGNAYLKALHWVAWGAASAFASGTETIRVCVPTCTSGRLHSFGVLAALWRAEPRPGHAGQSYFTRVTLIYTGNRSYRAGGKTYHLPQTVTYPLSASGGA